MNQRLTPVIGIAALTMLSLLTACGGGASEPPAAATSALAPASSSSPTSVTPSTPTAMPSSAVRTSASPSPVASPSAKPSPTPAQNPAAAITGALAGKDWTYIPTGRHIVALTFDAGANADGVASILSTLQRDHVPATFFLTGNFVQAYPAVARQIAAAGFAIGDHTITHPYLTQLSDAGVRAEIVGAARQIMAVTGINPAPLFRFPYGDADARTIGIANEVGFVPVRWTVDTLGWEGKAGHITASVVISRVITGLRPGEIVLMHVGSNPDDHTTYDADALPQLISALRAHGYSFVTLRALTG
jgi:peptidoglycan/xylan/chitin deacetylase (PgdA/CDA1 family)